MTQCSRFAVPTGRSTHRRHLPAETRGSAVNRNDKYIEKRPAGTACRSGWISRLDFRHHPGWYEACRPCHEARPRSGLAAGVDRRIRTQLAGLASEPHSNQVVTGHPEVLVVRKRPRAIDVDLSLRQVRHFRRDVCRKSFETHWIRLRASGQEQGSGRDCDQWQCVLHE